MADRDLTAHRLREVLHYDPTTGVFTRKVRLAQRHRIGDRADFIVTGGNLKGYRRVCVDSRRYLAHRVAWLYMHGEWPRMYIDHINGDKGDNRIGNLRDVPHVVNMENRYQPHGARAASGYRGVTAHEGRWRARIVVRGKPVCLGVHDTPEQASEAYLKAKALYHEGRM